MPIGVPILPSVPLVADQYECKGPMKASSASIATASAQRDRVLALFFSHGMSLSSWDTCGLFDREVGYYQGLAEAIGDVLFVTYDRASPGLEGYLRRIRPVTAIYNRWQLGYRIYGLVAPLLHSLQLRRCKAFKSNQLSGAWTAAIAKLILRRPLIVRCGYITSSFVKVGGASRARFLLTLLLERFSLRAADVVFVATESDRAHLVRAHRVSPERLRVMPNPIDTERFRRLSDRPKKPGRVVFVGRFSEQKCLDLLIDACIQVPGCELLLVGSGPLEPELRERARGAAIEFRGVVPNGQLPDLLNEAEVFVLPSRYEGCPKALLEAMACGLPVVGTNAPGIREIIQHGINGLLCEPRADLLASAVEELLRDEELRKRLGSQARQFVVDGYSQASLIRNETAILNQLVARKGS
jgi:glycosyltransferase involved in cell wall biosynthesis